MAERLRLWLEADRAGRGYHLRDAANGEPVRWEDERIRVVPVAGISFRTEAAVDASFDPGRRLALVPEPENEHDPHAVGIWNEARTLQAGYVPREVAATLAGDEQAVSLWRAEGGLRVLLAPADAWIGRPRLGCRAVAYSFKLPDLGEGLTEGEVARWLVAEGDEIAEDAPLVEIQTDKTTVEIPSPAAGTVSQILVPEGQVVPVGTVLVVIGADDPNLGVGRPGPGAPRPNVAPPSIDRSAGSSQRIQATPLVRRIAQELGVDLASVTPTGPGGRVTEDDVRGAGVSTPAPQPAPEERREPVRGVRRQIVEHLTRAHREIPAVTYVEECDFSTIDLKLLLPTVLRATALALQAYPELNARLDGDEIVYLERYDLGVAVQTDDGLVVPVVRGCDRRSVEELRAEVDRLAEAARAGKLAPEDLRGSTFTVTSAGKLAGLLVTPLVNHPEVGILGVHRIASRPVVRDGEVVVRPIGNVSVTFDHRVVDGARAAAFALDVIGRLEAGE